MKEILINIHLLQYIVNNKNLKINKIERIENIYNDYKINSLIYKEALKFIVWANLSNTIETLFSIKNISKTQTNENKRAHIKKDIYGALKHQNESVKK